MGSLLQWLFDLSPRQTSFAARGFRGGTPETRARLEAVGAAFVQGYRAALGSPKDKGQRAKGNTATHAGSSSLAGPCLELAARLDTVPIDFRGFAYEGAAMGLALLDYLTPWRRHRVQRFLAGPGDAHAYMVHVGVGWVLGRLPGNLGKFISRFDPLLRWLIVDGYGFHEAFFHWPRYLAGQPAPARVHGYARRVFDQGFGRCLWFVEGTEFRRIAQTIAGFPSERHGDLWSGIGLASVYAGEVTEAELLALREAAGPFAAQLAQGAAFAAKARQRAGNLSPYHDVACSLLCGLNASEAAQVTDEALENLPSDGAEPAYENWRRRIQQRLNQHTEVKK